MPQNRAAASTPAARRASSAPSSALDGERPLDEQQQAEQRRQPDQAGRDRLEQRVVGARAAPGSRSRAKANITITIAANGSTWLSATRLRHSMRRSLPATSRRRAHDASSRAPRTWPATTSTQRVASDPARSSSWLATIDRGAGRRRPGAAWRRARRGRRRRGRRAARRAATAGPGGRRGRPARCAAAGRPTGGAPAARRGGRPGRAAPAPRRPRRRWRPTVAPQKRTFSVTERSRYSPLRWPSRPTRRRTRGAVGGQVAAEHRAAAAGQREQPGAHPQQRRLAGAVGPAQQDDLAALDVQVDAGERRERAEHDDGVVQLDDACRGRSIAGRRYRRRAHRC